MGSRDFQGSGDNTVGMDILARQGTPDPQGIMKTRPRGTQGFLGSQAPLEEKDGGGLRDWHFLARREKGGSQEPQAARVRGAPMARRVRKVIQFLVMSAILGSQALRVLMDLQVQKDFQVLGVLLGRGVLTGKKVVLANREYQRYLVHLVFVVAWEIQVWKGTRAPLLPGPQALLVYRDEMVRKESLETPLMASQDPQERGVLQECQG